jgi:hypothetical protein
MPEANKETRLYAAFGFLVWILGLYGVWRSMHRWNVAGVIVCLSFALIGIKIAVRH